MSGAAFDALNTANNLANAGLSSAIGGGAVVAADGTVTPPSIAVGTVSYSNLTDAIEAAGAGFNLTTAATGTGVANSSSVEGIAAGETATITAGNNIVTTQVGNEVQVALSSDLTGLNSIGLTGGATLDSNGIAMNGDGITGLAAGSTAAGSADAINGGQLNNGLASVASGLGGGSAYDAVSGIVTAPTYNVQGSSFSNVGDAFGGVNSALTGLTNGTAGLVQQVGGAPGSGQITIGAVTGGSSISVAGTSGSRTVTGVAPAALTAISTDAVNGGQVNILASSAAAVLGGGSAFDPATGMLTAPIINVGGVAYNDVTSAIKAGDDKADEGLGDVANALGGGATYNPATGAITAPNYLLGGNTYNNVGSALAAIANGGLGPVQYANAATSQTPNSGTPTNNLTLVGAAAGPVTLDNVAAGSLTRRHCKPSMARS